MSSSRLSGAAATPQGLVRDAAKLSAELSEAQARQLLDLLDELTRWNAVHNLTAITDREEMVTHHLLDSLSVRPFLSGEHVADVGTGAGFPGLPLAVTNPHRHFTLIDSNQKKLRFVAHAARKLGLTNVETLHSRVEVLKPARPFDTVVARAFAPLPRLLEQVRPLFGAQTRGLAMKSERLSMESREVPPTWRIEEIREVVVPGLDEYRAIAIFGLAATVGR